MRRFVVLASLLSAGAAWFVTVDVAARAAEVTGRVVREGSEPIGFADIRACPEGRDTNCVSAVSDSRGDFQMEIAPGRYDVRTSLPSGTELPSILVVEDGKANTLEIMVPR